MHEYSIVQSLIDLCEDNVKKNSAKKVNKVVVKIGVQSGVEPDLLETAFQTFKEGTVCDGCEYEQIIQPIKIRCNSCQEEFELQKNEYLCPKCENGNFDIIDGEELLLMRLELE